MRGFLWLCAWVAVAVWSLVAFLAYGLLDAAGELAMRNADSFSADPETVEWIWRVFSWLHGLSTSVALVIWGIVSLAILAVPWLFDRLIGSSTVLRTPPPWAQPPVAGGPAANGPMGRAGDDVIDLEPDQYRVEPGGDRSGRPGPVPRIVPRG